jgi:alkylation response protein AidB-like acyl-CoA dehydrogenase
MHTDQSVCRRSASIPARKVAIVSESPVDADDLRRRVREFLDTHDPGATEPLEFLRARYDAGLAWVHFPSGLGGLDAPRALQPVVDEAFAAAGAPRNQPERNVIGLGMAAPTILRFGSDEQKSRLLRPLWTGEEIWCQLFSEPGAGSDLATLATRAVRDGDEWVVDGQKVWTSGAHHARWAILVARTDPDVPKHRGITYFLLDMRTPGIEVRPLRQITGFAHFNEVFLTDVRVPAENVLGGLNNGWMVAQTTLANERNMIGSGGTGITFSAILRLARECQVTADPGIRQELAKCYTRFEILKWLGLRARARAAAGQRLGPEASVMKLFVSQRIARDGDLVLALEGPYGMLRGADTVQNGMWQQVFLNQWSIRIGGGTEQIQRNVLGERVLGLPGDIRVDKDVPFRELRRN